MRIGEIRIVVLERAVFVAFRDVSSPQHAFSALLQPANAVFGELPAVLLEDPQPGSTAYRANFDSWPSCSVWQHSESNCPLCESELN